MSSVKRQLASGIFYTAAAKYAGIIISILITAVLARLLTPADFGTIVPVTVLVTFFTILGDIGIGPAIIQHANLHKKDIDSIFTLTIALGFVLALGFILAAPLVAHVYDNEVFVPLCRILSVSLFFSCGSVVLNALLYKAKAFGFLAMRSLSVQFCSGVIAIVSAFLGAGVYALVVQSLLSSIGLFAVGYRANPLKLSFKRVRHAVRQIREFSTYQFLFNILNYFSVNLDKLLLNKYLGASQLGYYDKSYKLMQMPLQNIPYVVNPVLHPVLAQMQTEPMKIRYLYAKIVRMLAFVSFPLSVFLFFSGGELVTIMFGSQWEQSIPVFKILALTVGFQVILSTSGSVFQASNTTHLLLLSGIVSTFNIVCGVLVGLFVFSSLEMLAVLLDCAYVLNFFACYIIMFAMLFKRGFGHFMKEFIAPVLLSLVMGVALFAVSFALQGLSAVPSLAVKGALSAIMLGSYMQISGEYDIVAKIKQISNKLRYKRSPRE